MYLEWLANMVLVMKANEKRRICFDFTDLNKTYLKDSYTLSRINQLVDTTMRHELRSFLDAYLAYHQISIASEDRENISFIIDQQTYCYNATLFELKKAGATFQALVNKVFTKQIGQNVEAYIDDIMIKVRKLMIIPKTVVRSLRCYESTR